jgi:hypothetical protein
VLAGGFSPSVSVHPRDASGDVCVGLRTDVPVVGDYDGDGKADDTWGGPGYLAVPDNYNGDGKTDVAVHDRRVIFISSDLTTPRS